MSAISTLGAARAHLTKMTRAAKTSAPRVLVIQSSRMGHHPRHHYRLATALQAAGYAVLMVAQPDLTPGHVDAVPMMYLPVRTNRLTRMLTGPLTMLRALRQRPDAIYIVSLDMLPWGVLARIFTRTVVVYDSNEEYDTYMLIKEWVPERLRPLLRRVVRWAEPWLASKLSAATTALPATQEKFEAAGVRSVHVRNFPPASLAEQRGRPESFDYDILIGGSLPDDQMPLLAATARELEARGLGDLRWLVVARNYGDRERELLISELEGAGVRDRFELRYNLPFLEMQGVMRSSRVAFLLYPSDENYAARIPIRIFEYMAAGVPFVGPDLPTTAQFVAGLGVADLAPAGDPVAYAEALAALLHDPERQAEMARRGPEVYRERYNWERESAKLVDLFQSLIPEPPLAAAASTREPASV